MEQMCFETGYAELSDCDRIKTALEVEMSDPKASEYLSVELNKDNTISINAKAGLAAKIKIGKKVSFIEIKEQYVKHFTIDNVVYPKSSAPRIMLSNINDVFDYMAQLCVIYIEALTEQAGEHFGCCHRYIACSDALKCVHPEFLPSLACGYKRNLDVGRVFYGKNKNI